MCVIMIFGMRVVTNKVASCNVLMYLREMLYTGGIVRSELRKCY